MQERVIIIFDHDLIGYPPTLSLINICLSLGKEVMFIGHYSDIEGKSILERKGVKFYEIDCYPNYNIKLGLLRRINIVFKLKKYESIFFKVVKSIDFKENDLIWFIFSEKALYLNKFLKNHKYIVQFYEFVDANFGGKYKFLYPSYDAASLLRNATSVVHCEYNRAVIMNGLYGVQGKINVLPNKPFIDNPVLTKAPQHIIDLYEKVKARVNNKIVILYQGIFSSEERRLEEFCQAISGMSSDYTFMAMGEGQYWDDLKDRYTSDQFVFVPFIKPPYHLLFTQLASIGVLNYLPVSRSVADVINPIYCAPNKVYEYTKYSIPIIGNDIPALRTIVEKYNCGKVVEQPMTPEMISRTLQEILDNLDIAKKGALDFYNSVDMKQIVQNILNISMCK